MSAKCYDLAFSLRVVESYIKAHPRGWAFFQRNYERFTESVLAKVFAYDQIKWRAFKNSVKLVERLEKTGNFDEAFILQRFLTDVKYFVAYEKKIDELFGDPRGKRLDRYQMTHLEF